MSAAINIQCRPTPFIWVGSTVWVPPVPAVGLTDEAGNILTDEADNVLMPDTATVNTLADENNNTLTDEQSNPLTPDA